ncbi:MAG: hemerythrin family protein [Proteobacteria bacterium]|nr:hemerythrin family protein [Pseudomonadota bacterium]
MSDIISNKQPRKSYVTWDDRYSVGISTLDKQHKILFGIINQLSGILEGEESRIKVVEIIVSLRNYAYIHFRDEEKEMEKLGYIGLNKHQSLHNMFISTVQRFENGLRNSDEINLELGLKLLTDWLTEHILIEDKKSLCLTNV